MTVGVIGESLVDLVTDATGVTIERPGGSPFNVAVGLARLGIDTRLFTCVGDDARGRLLQAFLAAEGIALTRGSGSGGTAIATASIDAAGRAAYAFEMIWDPRFGDDLPDLDVVHFGSLGSVLPPGAGEVARIVDGYVGRALISYDPNWREAIIDAVPRVVVEANAARADVVKLSAEDAAAIYPGAELESVARALLALGPALVIVTKGADGASAWTARTEKHCGAAPVEVIDTVGAGDAFMATVLSELAGMTRDKVAALNKRELELVLEFASFVAGRTCERIGADPPRIADLF